MKILYILALGFMVISICFTQQIAMGADAQTDYETGLRYYNSQDYAEALKWFRKSADQGDSMSQYFLASIYYSGQSVTQDYTEAAKWYRKSSDQGNPFAQISLGWMYYLGHGVPQNKPEAKNWFRKAAAQGSPLSFIPDEFSRGF